MQYLKNMPQNHREKTVSGVFWSVIEQFGNILVKLVLGIILARLLLPSDFGIIGMITVFFDVANELVQGGFGQAYIQKKNADKKDAATVFYFNLLISLILYGFLWLGAPLIANFYEQAQLLQITRIMSIVVIIDAIGVIKVATIIKEINFKKKTVIILFSTLISGVVSIILALKGFGVWSLVWYTILNKLLNTIGLWINTSKIPLKDFSLDSLKSMFSFGSWLLIASVLRKVFENINFLIIGKFFPVAQLGFYSKAKQFQQMASGQILQAVSIVAFPVFSLIQTDKERLKEGIRRFQQQVLLIVLPIILTLFVVAHPFVILFLTGKWESMILYLKLFCVIGAIFPLNAINIQVLVAQGHSKLNFKITLIKNVIRIVNVVIMYRFGVIFILAGEVLVSIISLFINTYYTGKILNYGLFKQIADLKYHYLGGIIAVIIGTLVKISFVNLYLSFLLGAVTTVSVFFIFQFFFNKEAFEVLLLLKEKIFNKFKDDGTV